MTLLGKWLQMASLVLWAFLIGPGLWVIWLLEPESLEKSMSMTLANAMLSGAEGRVDRWRDAMKAADEGSRARGVVVLSSHIIMPPEGSLLEPSWVLVLPLWCAPTLRRRVVERATARFRHRVKHYSLGTISKLVPEDS